MNEKVATRENLRKALKREEEYKIIAHWIHKECSNPIGQIKWLLKNTDEILSFSDDSIKDTYEEVLKE